MLRPALLPDGARPRTVVNRLVGRLAVRAQLATRDPMAGPHLGDGAIESQNTQGGPPRLAGEMPSLIHISEPTRPY